MHPSDPEKAAAAAAERGHAKNPPVAPVAEIAAAAAAEGAFVPGGTSQGFERKRLSGRPAAAGDLGT